MPNNNLVQPQWTSEPNDYKWVNTYTRVICNVSHIGDSYAHIWSMNAWGRIVTEVVPVKQFEREYRLRK